jgi:hypothetical protein
MGGAEMVDVLDSSSDMTPAIQGHKVLKAGRRDQ